MSALPEYDIPLFTPTGEPTAHARNTDPAESHAAAASVRNIGVLHRMILHALTLTPRTDEQLIQAVRGFGLFHATPSGVRSRRSELVAAGKVVRVGTGKTAAGRSCAVWGVSVCPGGSQTVNGVR